MDLPGSAWPIGAGNVQRWRAGVVDLGSNSVRLVVFEGRNRHPLAIFNEKAVLGLGRGLPQTGRLNEQAIAPALTVLARYHAAARAMRADPVEVLATSAVRDAENGADFVAALRSRMPDVPVRVLPGVEEAALSADGVLLGFPAADGVLADLGGGSLELVRLDAGRIGRAASMPVGTIRLADRAAGDVIRARAIVEAELGAESWINEAAGRDLYLVGGAWRALARMHIAQTGYPLAIVHHYVLRREEARDLAGVVMAASRRALERMPGVSTRRIGDLPFAAVVLRRLLRATGAARIVFSANGLREGWYARLLPEAVRAEDPLLAAAREMGLRFGRDAGLPPALLAWTNPLFPDESPAERSLRAASCWLSDVGAYDHPEYRAEQAFLRVLRQTGVGLDHHARAVLALTAALRYEAVADAQFLGVAAALLNAPAMHRAETLGAALRLAQTLSGGTPALLHGAVLAREGPLLTLRLRPDSGVFAGESVERRLAALAATLGLEPMMANAAG